MSVWQGLENQRMEGEEEKDAGLSGKGDRNTENVSRQEPSGPPIKATGTRKARPTNGGKPGATKAGQRREDGGLKAAATKAGQREKMAAPRAGPRQESGQAG